MAIMTRTVIHQWTFAALLCLSLLPVISLTDPPKCITQQGNCACETDQGLVDLSPLDSKDIGNPRFSNIPDPTTSGDTYAYNPCSGFTYTFSPCIDVALCQSRRIANDKYPIGESPATFVTDENGFQISYSSVYLGATRKSAIKLKCDTNEEGKLTSDGEDMATTTFKFTLTSKYACTPGGGGDEGGGGLSVGSIMLIVFFSLLFVYIIGGILYNKGAKGASGTELLPNVEFWSQVPGLIKEGFLYVKSSLTKICFKSSTYEKI